MSNLFDLSESDLKSKLNSENSVHAHTHTYKQSNTCAYRNHVCIWYYILLCEYWFRALRTIGSQLSLWQWVCHILIWHTETKIEKRKRATLNSFGNFLRNAFGHDWMRNRKVSMPQSQQKIIKIDTTTFACCCTHACPLHSQHATVTHTHGQCINC